MQLTTVRVCVCVSVKKADWRRAYRVKTKLWSVVVSRHPIITMFAWLCYNRAPVGDLCTHSTQQPPCENVKLGLTVSLLQYRDVKR